MCSSELTNGAFDPHIVDKEKRNLKQRIQSVFDDKMRYASVRLVEEMCKGEPYALYAHGEHDEVDKLRRSLYDYYVKQSKKMKLIYILSVILMMKKLNALQINLSI